MEKYSSISVRQGVGYEKKYHCNGEGLILVLEYSNGQQINSYEVDYAGCVAELQEVVMQNESA